MELNNRSKTPSALEQQCLRLQDAYLKFKIQNRSLPIRQQERVSSSLTIDDVKIACLIEEVQINLDAILNSPS